MNIIVGKPPIYDQIVEKIGRPPANAVYTWGRDLYVGKDFVTLDPALAAHEHTHTLQQEAVGGPEKWWELYLNIPTFRLLQEVEAYRNQYAMTAEFPRMQRRAFLRRLARHLSGPMYGNVVSYSGALTALTEKW